ncbi:hypothetical protein JKP88DRAFT_297000 [Tribonema minus]|uniref:Uncharacterized protein n=1 Tax=Tribonema minus TaxID=303371 RepID=A0A835ZDE0_9STRA|nr:hypothetical protein JKP88DRAFT_297000 [Tribonema minus]
MKLKPHQRHNGFPREDRHASDLACRTVIITGWDPDTAPEDEAAILSLFEHAGRHTTAWQGQRGAAGRSATLVYDKVAQAARARRLHRLASGLHAAFPPPCSGGGDGAAAAASPPESGRRTPVKQQQQAATPPTPPATPTPTARPGGSSRGGGNITVVSARGVTLDGCDESARRGAPRTLRDIEPLAIYVTGWSNVPSPRDRDRLLEPFTSQGAIVTWLPRSAPPPRQQQADGDGADGDGAAAPAAAAAAAWDSEPSQWPGGNGGGGGATAGGDGDAAARAEDADTEETAVVVFGARLHAARAAEARRLGDAGLRARALRDAPPALAAALRELPLRVPARPPLDTSVASRLIAASLGIRRATPPPPPGGGGPREDAAGDEGEGSSGGGGGGGGAA